MHSNSQLTVLSVEHAQARGPTRTTMPSASTTRLFALIIVAAVSARLKLAAATPSPTVAFEASFELGVALPVGIGFFLARRVHQQTAAPAAYREVARRLGLEVDTRGASVNGYLVAERRKLYIGEVMVGHGPDRTTQHRAVLSLDRPLGLGVAVRKRTGRSWFRRERGHVIQTGHAEFDKHFRISGDDDERVRALLDDNVRARIEALAAKHPNLLVSDHHVRALLRCSCLPGSCCQASDGATHTDELRFAYDFLLPVGTPVLAPHHAL